MNYHFAICLDESLQEFLDGKGLGNSVADHRTSSDAYVEWGRRRSEMVLMNNVTCMEFEGREDTIGSVLHNVCSTILEPTAKKPLYFIHASPGMGKTRLFLEMVRIGADEQKRLLSGLPDRKEAIDLVDDFLHIAVSFNGCTTYDPMHIKITDVPDILSHISLRIMHIWLSTVAIEDLFKAITTAMKAGEVTDELLSLKAVLKLVSRRTGRKRIVLFIDEILKIYDSDVMNHLVLRLCAAQDEVSYSLRGCYSALRVDIFERVRSNSGRDIICTPLRLISRAITRSISTKVVKRDKYPRLWEASTKRQFIEMMTLLSGGHMRAMETLALTLAHHEGSESVMEYIRKACRNYVRSFETNIYGAVLLSLLGYSVSKDTIVNDSGKSITVEDMVASGRLMASFETVETNLDVMPNMPLISLIQWAFRTFDEFRNVKKKSKRLGYEVARTISYMLHVAVATGPVSGKKFEYVCIMRHILMRQLYKSLMEENIVRNITGVDWRKATLKDYFKYTRCEGRISAELSTLTFDFTQLLPNEWELLKDDDAVKKFFKKNYTRKRSAIGQPTNPNFEAIDYFLCLVSNCGVVVTIVCQTKFSSEISTTKVQMNDIETTLEKAMKITNEDFGVPKNSIISIAELWRMSPGKSKVNEPMKLENSFVQTKQVGPLMADLMALADL